MAYLPVNPSMENTGQYPSLTSHKKGSVVSVFSNMHETWSKCLAWLHFSLPQGFVIHLSVPQPLFSWAAVLLWLLLSLCQSLYSDGLGGQAESMSVLFHKYIPLDMLMARVVYPFVHYPMQYQINQGFLWSLMNNRAGTAAQPAGPVSCLSQQSHWILEGKSKIAQSSDTSSEYPPTSPAVCGAEVSWARSSGECRSSQLVLQRLPAEVTVMHHSSPCTLVEVSTEWRQEEKTDVFPYSMQNT